ncbi:MAG: response regulator [Sphingobacteriaceae bacterium]
MKKKILIIDNEHDIVDIIAYILSEEGYEVFNLSSIPADILEIIKKINPDLILLDDWLDEVSGSEFCKIFKTEHTNYQIPIVMISANADLAEIATNCMADSYIEKPFDVVPMLHVINDVLKKGDIIHS